MNSGMRLLFSSVCASLLAAPLAATQFAPMSIEEIAAAADVIVQGAVVSKTCARDDAGRIFTKVELAVSETWKGQAVTNLSIFQSGGILGEEGAMIPGQADYEIGEEVVAFLVLNHRGEAITLGLAHGKFHVWKDPNTGEKLARNIFHGGGTKEAVVPGKTSGNARLKVVELKRRALERKS